MPSVPFSRSLILSTSIIRCSYSWSCRRKRITWLSATLSARDLLIPAISSRIRTLRIELCSVRRAILRAHQEGKRKSCPRSAVPHIVIRQFLVRQYCHRAVNPVMQPLDFVCDLLCELMHGAPQAVAHVAHSLSVPRRTGGLTHRHAIAHRGKPAIRPLTILALPARPALTGVRIPEVKPQRPLRPQHPPHLAEYVHHRRHVFRKTGFQPQLAGHPIIPQAPVRR